MAATTRVASVGCGLLALLSAADAFTRPAPGSLKMSLGAAAPGECLCCVLGTCRSISAASTDLQLTRARSFPPPPAVNTVESFKQTADLALAKDKKVRGGVSKALRGPEQHERGCCGALVAEPIDRWLDRAIPSLTHTSAPYQIHTAQDLAAGVDGLHRDADAGHLRGAARPVRGDGAGGGQQRGPARAADRAVPAQGKGGKQGEGQAGQGEGRPSAGQRHRSVDGRSD